jgi:hypothetical protein
MARDEKDTISKKEAMKKLRDVRKELVQAATLRMKIQKKAVKGIKELLENEALTVPEIATATGTSTMETLWYIASLKKYGQIIEAEKDGSYFKYTLAGKQTSENLSEKGTNNPV